MRVKSYDELNDWLMDKCIAWAKAHSHPEQPDRTIWEVFEERPKLILYRGCFDGLQAYAYRTAGDGAPGRARSAEARPSDHSNATDTAKTAIPPSAKAAPRKPVEAQP